MARHLPGEDEPEVIRAPGFEGIPHGFLGRHGGVSSGALAGLNCGLGSGDDAAAVDENRARAAQAVLPGARLVALYQVHSADCVTVTQPWDDGARPSADALVTNRTGVLLGIVTADCAPVLFVDSEAGVIGAAHAGWKGAIAGVTGRTIAAMEALGARRSAIAVAIGPCISGPSYEVDESFRARFIADDSASARFFVSGKPDHWQFDLEAYVAYRLSLAGIARIAALGLDTYGDPARFYSFRRATHRGEPTYGRQISLIGLKTPA